MNKTLYFAGGYPVGSSKYRMAKKKFGEIPATTPTVKAAAPAKQERVVKKTTRKKTEG